MKDMGIFMGPRKVLAERIAAVSAPPTAASGFQDDPDATEFIRGLAKAKPTDLGAGVQVFELTKSLPAEPYQQSGSKLLTRNTTRQAWKATFTVMQTGIKRVAMLGIPGIGKSRSLALGLWHLVTGELLQGLSQPVAIVYEAREGVKVYFFTKDQSGQWKAQSRSMHQWDAASCEHLTCADNWYLVDAYNTLSTGKFIARTVLACSPDRKHYSNFLKDGGRCVYCESWSKSELEAAHTRIDGCDLKTMLERYDKIGGNLRALLLDEDTFKKYVRDQNSEAVDWSRLRPAFCGTLDNQDKILLTRLFTYVSKDGLDYKVDFCCTGVAAQLADMHYNNLVQMWSDPNDSNSRKWFENFVGPLLTSPWCRQQKLAAWTITNKGKEKTTWNHSNPFEVVDVLELLECDTSEVFDHRWRAAVGQDLKKKLLHSPDLYPGIDYLLEFNHGISVMNSLSHNIAPLFLDKLRGAFEGHTEHSFTLTFFITGAPASFKPKSGQEFNNLMALAKEPNPVFKNVHVQVVQIPKTREPLTSTMPTASETRSIFDGSTRLGVAFARPRVGGRAAGWLAISSGQIGRTLVSLKFCLSCNCIFAAFRLHLRSVTGKCLPEGFRQPEAIVYEAREGGRVFLFTKGQDDQWKGQRQSMRPWDAADCLYLEDPNNCYLVDAFEKRPTLKLAAKTWLACSPDREHYSDFIKSGGTCVYVEAFSWQPRAGHFWTRDVRGARAALMAAGHCLRVAKRW
ncbi:unnamed protein product, partial [Symbiodinium necroappetens]